MGRTAGRGGATVKLPRYVHGFVDRHGTASILLSSGRLQESALPGLPWSPDFMRAYQAALAGQPPAIGAAGVLPGSMRALAISYYSSPEYLAMKGSSQRVRRNIIEKFCREIDANGQPNGDKRAAFLHREHLVRFMAVRASKPESANGLRKALRALMQHAVAMNMRRDDPTQGIRPIAPASRRGFPHVGRGSRLHSSRLSTQSA